ncbi:MAG: hypothetical protein P8171_03480 [Candidatus Thiodiazotropha sp.]|jgi:hypothetical protein
MPCVRGVDLKRELASGSVEGLSPASARLREQAVAMICEEQLIKASYSYNIVPLDHPADGPLLKAGGEYLEAPLLMPESGELTALGCGVYTLGEGFENRVRALFEARRAALAVVLDELGIELLYAMGRRIQDRMLSECYRKRLSMGAELHAGDPGLALDAQAAVLRLAEAEKIDVGLHRGQLITPLKSGSVVFAVGRNLPEVAWSRCDTCPSKNKCNFGRRQRAAAPTSMSA